MPDFTPFILDAQQAEGFLIPQQYRVETEVYQIKYPAFDYAQFMFVDTSGDMWEVGSVFYSQDIAGSPKWMAGGAFDMPYADANRTQYLRGNHLAAIGYEWNLQELKRAASIGRDLSAEKAAGASKLAEKFIYDIAIRGSTEKLTTGLINDSRVPTAYVAATGTGSTTTWSTKTPAQILTDVNECLNAPEAATGETQMADTLVIPTARLQYLSTTLLTANGTDSILNFIREQNYFTLTTRRPLKILPSRELAAAGASGSARMMSYDSGKDVVQFHLPGPHEFLPPFQKSSMTWDVGGIMNIGGTDIRLPLALAYRDGI